jgi:NADH:ubiquinone oxidoreductase subunit E
MVDCPKVAKEMYKHPNVVFSTDYRYMCSDPGRDLIINSIKEHNLDRIVVASCSPRMHERTFRSFSQAGGVNWYMCEMANIRDQCSWCHNDYQKATQKAIDLVFMAIAKVNKNRPLTKMKAKVTNKALVIGGGITGIQAAIDLGTAGYKTILVEKTPSIGGKMAMLDKTFPTLDCSACILTPKMVEVAQNENITLYTYSEIEEVNGYIGNFEVKIRKKARSIDEENCTGCGLCSSNCLVQNIAYIDKKRREVELEPADLEKINKIMENYEASKENLLAILQDIQAEYRYIPQDILRYIAQRLDVPVSQAYNLATFFTAFSLTPKGENIINVCLGTACHIKGAPLLMEALERELGISDGETTEDLKFTLQSVRCLGCCALAPVLTINGKAYGKLTPDKIPSILKAYA